VRYDLEDKELHISAVRSANKRISFTDALICTIQILTLQQPAKELAVCVT